MSAPPATAAARVTTTTPSGRVARSPPTPGCLRGRPSKIDVRAPPPKVAHHTGAEERGGGGALRDLRRGGARGRGGAGGARAHRAGVRAERTTGNPR